ncbi:hypothetical protein QO200_01025 [Flavobacterium sp. Arc3]|uniref:hypothetical protein n=1 Tax=Flavobacterium sp. Arc3 TaxID=3046686 RepID=UPI00352BFD04
MYSKKYAVVIVAKEISDNILEYYSSGEISYDLFLVSPDYSTSLKDKYKTIIFRKDSEFFDRDSYEVIEKTDRPNWYYQQFLKYCVVINLHKEFYYDFVHIVDGDSFLRKEILLEEKIYYTPKTIEKQYQNFIDRTELKLKDDKNFISNQMCFNPMYLNEMLTNIARDKDWVDYFLEIIVKNDSCWLSEYQLYACYVKYKHSIEEEELKVFRRLDLINVSVEKSLEKYTVVANEVQHNAGLLRTLRANLYFAFGKNLG